jgi:dynein heavy chain
MAALQERHRWMATNVAVAMDMPDKLKYVEDMLSEYNNFKKINDFLEGKSKHRHIFVYYQQQDHMNDHNEIISRGESKLMITTGDNEEMRIKGKAVYFVRNVPDQKPVKSDVPCDNELLFGEMAACPLYSLDMGLQGVFKPLVDDAPLDWQSCESEQAKEFKTGLDHFTMELSEGIKSLTCQIELPNPELTDDDVKKSNFMDVARDKPDIVDEYNNVLQGWCVTIGKFLENGDGSQKQSSDQGPRTELEFWRNRLQQITSITEQLKAKERKGVLGVLHAVARLGPDAPAKARNSVTKTIRDYKQIDISITEAQNEAKDNVKYLTTLDKFVDPLYVSTPAAIVDTLPALMNAAKMVHTIARYYNTTERMTNLFTKITNQMIWNCKVSILEGETSEALWERDPLLLIEKLEACMKLNDVYQEQYKATKETLLQLPKGKQFDFSETLIFGRFELFARRVYKLTDMFQTIHQFKSLSQHRFDGMEPLVKTFNRILEDFQSRKHDLMDYQNNQFDREYVKFNAKISDLETNLRHFINQSFEQIPSIEKSLNLLKKFQSILQREGLRADLESKFAVIFHNYGMELTQVQDQYEKLKAAPPIVRNLPPVAGHITWSRHLYRRIEGPMRKFQCNPAVLAGRDSRKLIRMYNKMAKTLIEFETLWYQAWVGNIEAVKSGLQATLIVKHPEDGLKYHVNFDWEILQLVRETRCLDRMGGIEIPESAKMVLLQERKFKSYHQELSFFLKEYSRVTQSVKPIVANLMRPHIETLEYKMRPGMVALTWTSMNIEGFLDDVWKELGKLEQLIHTINDITDNRIDINLKGVTNVSLVNLPDEAEQVSLDEFVDMQERHVRNTTEQLVAKSTEIENAVNDMLGIMVSFEFDSHVSPITESEIIKVKAHYNWSMYQALLNATKKSLKSMKQRLSSNYKEGKRLPPAFFEVDLQLDGIGVRLVPSVEEIQAAINGGAVAVLKCSKMIEAWDTVTIPKNVQLILNPNLPPVQGTGMQGTYYDRIAQDREILKVVLLLTGSIQSAKNQCMEYIQTFSELEWVWTKNIGKEYEAFKGTTPSLDDFEAKLNEFAGIENKVKQMDGKHQITALMLSTSKLGDELKRLATTWKESFAKELHKDAYVKLDSVSNIIKDARKKLSKEVQTVDPDTIALTMIALKEVREKQSEIELEFIPIEHMYRILDEHVPALTSQDREEQDLKSELTPSWTKLLEDSVSRQEELSVKQVEYKKELIKTVNTFKKQVTKFRSDYDRHGPMVKGIPPQEAVERLKRFREEFDVHSRKQHIYFTGEDLLGLPHQQYPKLDQTKQELHYLSTLYDLYVAVLETISGYRELAWADVGDKVDSMKTTIDGFAARCKKMPKQLRDWPAYHELKKEIEDFQEGLPLMLELMKPSIMPRHWQQVMDITGKDLPFESDTFKLQSLIDANLNEYVDEVSDICEGADKQLVIENKLKEISTQWEGMLFDFAGWKGRDQPCTIVPAKVGETQDALEETMMALNTMNAQRHSIPFKEELTGLLGTLSNTADTIERWFKVQQMWTSLESVFTSGDIAKQMPMEAKKFQQIDKDWIKIMAKSAETKLVVPCCTNEMLTQMLPVLSSGLESCQKSLESYLEGKRNKFPRFYFTSDPVLLKILSQGSDPESIQDDFEKLFDSISRVEFDKVDRKKIIQIQGIAGSAKEIVVLQTPQHAVGNIEDWLLNLEYEMQRSCRRECRTCAMEIGNLMQGLSMADFGNKSIAQVAIIGLQFIWTTDFEDALTRMSRDKDRKVMGEANKKFIQMLSDLVTLCLTDLGSKMNRTKFETLITIHVHQKDLFQEVWKKQREGKVRDENDFEWLKQTRCYWRTSTDHAVVSIADVDFTYSYEYLGCKERLVITALTDRCYVTQSQALGMFFGGAPAGPAGTGKTETTKDMGRTLGLFVVVTNCSDQMRFRDMAKIFKGLCMSGLWGCFDEFNRIELEVLSVVAMQVDAIGLAKKADMKTFMFPGEAAPIKLVMSVGYFITMNPGYAGRQELPENLKVLFRSVSMMVPNRETIMKVKLASVGYSKMDLLGKKFCVLYNLCEQQLSKQRHYDFGLRNILSVLRTSGAMKRSEPPDTDEEMLFMRTVRDMNLSKLVSDDVPLFLALLKDIFPTTPEPPNKVYENIDRGVKSLVTRNKLILYPSWFLKVIQLYEVSLVRHGFMTVGPTLCGKTEIEQILMNCMTEDNNPHKYYTMNPKAITDSQMYGFKDPVSEEWTPGVFATLWQRCNNRTRPFTSWLICDGPVDAIWIENLNTVLDDNKILTLANNDRIPMTDNCKIVFEVENLRNASPATVSRAGIVFVSSSDLGWKPMIETWLLRRVDFGANRQPEADILKPLFDKWLGTPPPNAGAAQDFFDWKMRNIKSVMDMNDSLIICQVLNLLSASLTTAIQENYLLADDAYQRLLVWCIMWGFGGLLEPEEREKMWSKMIEILEADKKKAIIPQCAEGTTVFEYIPDPEERSRPWKMWSPPEWKAPKKLQFSALLIPTMDSCRAEHILTISAAAEVTRTPPHFKSSMMIGLAGTAKTSTALMWMAQFSPDSMLSKRFNLSSATSPLALQKSVEDVVERKTGKTFCPPGGKKMTIFIDDTSMPIVNKWGDQITNELSRQLIEMTGFYFLDKDKRGDFKTVEGLQFVGAMAHPGGGKNDIPNRLKSKFICFNMVSPSQLSVDNIFGSIMKARFTAKAGAKPPVIELSKKLVGATSDVWGKVKKSLLPTPLRFHYLFNMRDLSRVFQGMMECPPELIKDETTMVGLWKHECTRVFADKLCRDVDKNFVDKCTGEFMLQHFGEALTESCKEREKETPPWFCDFQREMEFDDETGEELGAPKIYEPAQSWEFVQGKAYEYLKKFNENFPSKAMNLVLFDEAMCHLMKINRAIQQKRGSAMLVGVGGSGKQSLVRLAGFTSTHFVFQITITKNYNDGAFFEDFRNMYARAGCKNEQVTFLFTDAEVKSENFLEYMNSFLATGDITGLFQKDEKDGMASETRNDFVRDNPGMEENILNMYNYFMDRLRDNLHICLCFSPVSAKFPIRNQKFPAVFTVNINWFMPWPESALEAVATAILSSYNLDCTQNDRTKLYGLLGAFQSSVRDMTEIYLARMRKYVYVTPKSFLCLIDFYKQLYVVKVDDISVQEKNVNNGLIKLKEAAEFVGKLQIELKDQEVVIAGETKKTNALLEKVLGEKAKADKTAGEVNEIKAGCVAEATAIDAEKAEAQVELDKAMPFLKDAESACNSIQKKDVQEIKTNNKPVDIIKLVFDGLQIIMQKPIIPVKVESRQIKGVAADFLADSYEEYAKKELSDMNFLKNILDFANYEKDSINDETVELLQPYLRYDENPAKNWSPWPHCAIDAELAGKASGAASGLAKFVAAMCQYQGAAKIVQPKMAALKVAEARLEKANKQLSKAQEELDRVMAIVADLDKQLDEANAKMDSLKKTADAMQRQMDAANKLLSGLSGENTRWTEDSKNFALRKKKMVGDVACVCAFVSYVGPFNTEFRDKLYNGFLEMVQQRGVPGHTKVDQVSFLVDAGTIGEWALEGLPSDELSIQNAIMVTRSSRFPLMVDPQGQANRWIKSREAPRISQNPAMCITTLSARNLKDQIEFTMGEGLCLLIENVENDVDPMLDPLMGKEIIKKGKNLYINISDQNMDFNPKFALYFTSRLASPHFSPELSARATVIDFTVTLKGLEQQLLGKLVSMEQRQLEETLNALEEDCTNNTKMLQMLDKQLLDRLSNSSGNLLEDTELIEVLANTKAKSQEVAGKLKEAGERKAEINEKREIFRPVATRGSILYFNMVDMTNVVNPITAQMSGWMYNCSLLQFLEQFELSVRNSEKCQPASKRSDKIIHYLTYQVYRYMNRALFERDKMMFKLLVTMKIMVVANQITAADSSVFLKGGSSLDSKAERSKPFKWMNEKSWLNVICLTRHAFGVDQTLFYRELADFIQRNEANWRKWAEENEPESFPVPDYDERITQERVLGPFLRLCIVRCLRDDRTSVACAQFVEAMLDSRFTAPVTDGIVDIYDESTARKPVLYLLTAGSDPTLTIDELAKKKKKFPTDKVSMGEGQEKVAREKNNAAFITGGWVILQNSHLGIGYMCELEDVLVKTEEIAEDYRLWITCEITPRFPVGLLQLVIKVTMEAPQGIKAGLMRTYSTMVSQELLDKIDHEKWRLLVYVQCFLHSTVQDRRKFGPIGWCVPYEYNNSDLDACLLMLERHLSATLLVGQPMSWITIQYMVAEAQYGGRITDDLDRELFSTYTYKYMCEDVFKPSFCFNNYVSDYNYKIPEGLEIQQYKDAIDTCPAVDSPLIFGLHTNADLTYRLKEASEMIATIVETQPKEAGGAGGKTMDEIVKDQCLDLAGKMPPDFVEEIFRATIMKLKGAPNTPDKGLNAPLNIFLFQELQRLQIILKIVRTNLNNIAAAIDGTVVMTTELLEDLGGIFDARVPKSWTHDPSGAEISWLLPNLGGWFTGLLDRQQMLNTWLEGSRSVMKSYWITGFTNSQGFLTGMRQEVTRQQRAKGWALDDVISHTEILAVDFERVKDIPEEGQNMHGCFMEGGRWNRAETKLDESEPGVLFTVMPAIWVTATTGPEFKKMGVSYGPNGAYDSAVYKYPKRNDRYLIFRMKMRTEVHPNHWKLRGVCLVAQTE